MMTKLRSNPSTVALIVAILILAINLGNALWVYGRNAVMSLNFPYPLDYGEGAVLDQTLRLASGEAIYRSSVASPPYTITNDPPLYMLLQVPFVRIFGPAFWYGRALSILSLFLAAIFLGLTVFQLSGDRMASVIGGLLLFTIPYFLNLSVLDRVDTLGLALSWGGLYIIVRWPDRGWGLVGAGLLFTAAIFTQRTYILAAPATALIWLFRSRRIRQAVGLLVGTGGACLILFLGINALTRGGFFFNIITANINTWNFQIILAKLIEISIHSFFLVLIALTFFIGERMDAPTRTWPFVLAYLIAALLATILIGKSGPGDNGLLELAAALCLVCGAAIAWIKNNWARTALLVFLAMQVSYFMTWTNADYLPKFVDKFQDKAEIGQLASLIQRTNDPILVDEYMGLLPLSGRRLYYQPFEFYQLARAGVWDPNQLIGDVIRQKFSTLLIYFPSDVYVTLSRWPEKVYSALWANYDHTDEIASTLIFFPKPR